MTDAKTPDVPKSDWVYVGNGVFRAPAAASQAAVPPVMAGNTVEKKVEAVPVPKMIKPAVLKNALKGRGPKSGGMIRVKLWQKISQSQATTALVTASALQPPSAQSFSTFGTVYDEARCLGVEVHTWAASDQGTQQPVPFWCNTFDPSISGNLSSVIEALEQKYRTPVCAATCASASASTTAVATKTGLQVFRAKTVKDAFESSVTADKVGGTWFPCSSSTAIIGYLKPYVENPGATTVYLVSWVGYDMEFKYRG